LLGGPPRATDVRQFVPVLYPPGAPQPTAAEIRRELFVSKSAGRPSTQLSAPTRAITEAVPTTISGFKLAEQSSKTILELPSVSVPATPDLPSTLASAKARAHEWLDHIQPRVVQAIKSVTEFGKKFDSFYQRLSAAAKHLPQTSDRFKELIGNLREVTTKEESAIQPLARVLKDYGSQVGGGSRAFAAAEADVTSKLSTNQEEIESLKIRSEQVQKDMESVHTSYILIHLNPFVWFDGKLERLKAHYNHLARELNDLRFFTENRQQKADGLRRVLTSVKQHAHASLNVFAGVTALAVGWDTLNANFAVLLEKEQIEPSGSWTESSLRDAKSWSDDFVLNHARKLVS